MATQTRQEVFDKVVDHLWSMSERAFDEELYSCLYLTPSGNRCAVGCLLEIPDEDKETAYTYEGTIDDLMSDHPEWIPDSLGLEEDVSMARLLYDLQNVHDRETNWIGDRKEMDQWLKYIATNRNLKYDTHFPEA